ncbi:hypothetical protein [Pectobacterium phage Wc4-1]|jgi:hypothetical protein|uniref:Holin n=3 Tax=Arnovirus TaxID=3425109 RepID=A0A5P8D6A6_9CAUD|nr:hypothetical protein Arno162_100 [Pectobacterium phage Arno162]AZV02287.1 hypothetical protein Arno18_101 [Pectobacterium phage Arno18]QFP93849.1 hypothetical protein [Pectobacterium phage Wc4]QFP93994.1 hypothetical protein [Pectobacterium phage Wc4-1]
MNSKLLWLFAAGVCGSIVGLGINPSCDTPLKRALFLFGGLACTMFLAAPIATNFGLKDPSEIAAVGFAVAIFWQQIVSKLAGVVDGITLFSGKK